MDFTRINNDVNGNPRYVVHYTEIPLSEIEEVELDNPIKRRKNGSLFIDNRFKIERHYELALNKARKIGGRKFHNKQFGGGICFQSYNLADLEKLIIEIRG